MSTGTILALGIAAYAAWGKREEIKEKLGEWMPEMTGTTKLLLAAVAVLAADRVLPSLDLGSLELPSLPSLVQPSEDTKDSPVSLGALCEAMAARVPVAEKLETTRNWWEFWDTAIEAAGRGADPGLPMLNGQLAAAVGERGDSTDLSTELSNEKKQAILAVLRTQFEGGT